MGPWPYPNACSGIWNSCMQKEFFLSFWKKNDKYLYTLNSFRQAQDHILGMTRSCSGFFSPAWFIFPIATEKMNCRFINIGHFPPFSPLNMLCLTSLKSFWVMALKREYKSYLCFSGKIPPGTARPSRTAEHAPHAGHIPPAASTLLAG